jgi:hypothetical protein
MLSLRTRASARRLLSISLVVAACADPFSTTADSNAILPSLPTDASYNVAYTDEYFWSGGPGTSMGSTAGRVCFLTFVRGDFSSSFDYVRIYASGGSWYLGGATARGDGFGVDARARCAQVIGVSAEYVATSTGSAASITLPGSGCGLTGIGGKFDTVIDRVHIIPGGPAPDYAERTLVVWAAANGYVTGRARCASASAGLQSASWQWHEGNNPTQLMPTPGTLCYLTGVRGRMKSWSEFVRVWQAYGGWLLGGWSEEGYINALGGCLQ